MLCAQHTPFCHLIVASVVEPGLDKSEHSDKASEQEHQFVLEAALRSRLDLA
jgi:hypothetical protein